MEPKNSMQEAVLNDSKLDSKEKQTTPKEKEFEIGDESDEDLLAPTIFLYNSKTCQEKRTPEKILTPTKGNDLSPITPREQIIKQKKRRTKFSFANLVKQKAAQDEIDRKLAKMDEELRHGIENGGILEMILKDDNKDLIDTNASYESQENIDLLPQHQQELDMNVRKMNEGFGNDFPDGFPGEVFFCHKPKPVDLSTPKFVQELIGVEENFQKQPKKPSNDVDSLTKEFLMSGFLVDMSLFKKAVDGTVLDWLLSCICSSLDFEVIETAFNAFWAIIMNKELNLDWQFTTEKFWESLLNMGASEERTFTEKSLRDLLPSRKNNLVPGPLRPKNERLSYLFLHRLQTLLKAYCCYIKEYGQMVLQNTHIMLNILLAFRLGIASEINTCSWETEVLLGCCLDLYNNEHWEEEVSAICKNAIQLTKNHSNKLQLVEMVPVTQRGRELKKLLALCMLSSLSAISKTDTDDIGKYLKRSIVATVLDIISHIRTNQDTDFHQLFTILSFINHCIPEESVVPTDKKKLESLVSVLRRMNGDIRDPGGYYMNRTKVKDLILRTLNRLSHIASGLETQSNLDGYFGEKYATFDQLKFETLEDQPDKMEDTTDEDAEDTSKPTELRNPTQQSSASSLESSASDENLTDDDEMMEEDPLADLKH